MSISLNPYLNFDGNTKEAVYFYEKALGGKVMGIMLFGDMPADPEHPVTDEMKDRVMHAHLKVGDFDLMFSDTFPGMPFQAGGDTVQIAIHPTEEAQARAIFAALEDGGQVVMPLQQTEWSPLYGIVKDKFGVTFQVNMPAEQPCVE
ncbi:VOC family protein [Paenibacillus aurantiacus]|uniref:VOC family protein n=1 Tax=Paenibacillus aurantiacus TaxID=1936118 RepID=A0ABV5KUI1_9BACL